MHTNLCVSIHGPRPKGQIFLQIQIAAKMFPPKIYSRVKYSVTFSRYTKIQC